MEFWTEQRAQLRDLLAHGDRERFLDWDPIVDAMFFEPPPDELRFLQSLPNWPFIKGLLKDPGVGGAAIDPELGTNGNIVHHAFAMFQFEHATGHELTGDGHILEVGGGYGNFCRLAYKRGFTGRYTIYDLPEVLELQRWYHSRTLSRQEQAKVTYVTELPRGADTIIGLWSISEMPIELRDRIKALAPKYFLVGYQHNFSDIMNVDYFSHWIADRSYDWIQKEIIYFGSNYYLFGVRR